MTHALFGRGAARLGREISVAPHEIEAEADSVRDVRVRHIVNY